MYKYVYIDIVPLRGTVVTCLCVGCWEGGNLRVVGDRFSRSLANTLKSHATAAACISLSPSVGAACAFSLSASTRVTRTTTPPRCIPPKDLPPPFPADTEAIVKDLDPIGNLASTACLPCLRPCSFGSGCFLCPFFFFLSAHDGSLRTRARWDRFLPPLSSRCPLVFAPSPFLFPFSCRPFSC